MAAATLLVRSEVVDVGDPLPAGALAAFTESQQLARDVKLDLGYAALGETVNPQMAAAARHTLGLRLASALRSLGISPFTRESVARYQREQLELRRWRGKPKPRFAMSEGVAALIFVASIALGVAALCVGSTVTHGQPHAANVLAKWLLGLSIVMFFANGFVSTFLTPAEGEWRRFPLARYWDPVPEFALRKALALKRALPEVELYIEALGRDPFLVAACGDREAYIEAFSEPEFEAKL